MSTNTSDYPKHYCGVFGIFGHPSAAELTYYGLYALQHRGQESAGIATWDGDQMLSHKGMGLVGNIFTPEVLVRDYASASAKLYGVGQSREVKFLKDRAKADLKNK